MKEVKKLLIVCNFQHSQDWPGVWTCCTQPLLCFQKTANCFSQRFPKHALLLLWYVLFRHVFSPMFFLRTPYFPAAFLIERSFAMSCFFVVFVCFFCVFKFSFWLALGKAASFSLDWMQQQKKTTKWIKKHVHCGDFYEKKFGQKFKVENYLGCQKVLPGITL